MDLTVFYALNHSEYIKDIVYPTVDRELSAGGGIDSGLAAFLKKKYRYTPIGTAGTQRKGRRRRERLMAAAEPGATKPLSISLSPAYFDILEQWPV